MNLDFIAYWMQERELIRVKKERGDPWPWTTDPILQQYRFCNVRREDDRVTVWIRENIREPYADHPQLWLMICIARTINWPATLAELIGSKAWPSEPRFTPAQITKILEARKRRGEKVYTGAYMIRAENDASKPWGHWSKNRYIAEVVIGEPWKKRHQWWHTNSQLRSLEHAHEWLLNFRGWGPFMAWQAVYDMAYTRVLSGAADRHTWGAAGPGTIRGLNRIHGRKVTTQIKPEQALEEVRELDTVLRKNLTIQFDSLGDVMNSCCEMDKWCRVKNNEGRPRALYVPGRGA